MRGALFGPLEVVHRMIHKLPGQLLRLPGRPQRSTAPLPSGLLQGLYGLFNLAHGFKRSNNFNLGSVLSAGNNNRQHKPKKEASRASSGLQLAGLRARASQVPQALLMAGN